MIKTIYLCLSAKLYNADIDIVARAFEMNMYEKFKKAGAKYIVSPNFIGGMRIASEILRPHVVTFLDKMLKAKDKSIRVEESVIQSDSPLIGKSIKEIKFQEETGVGILACSQDGVAFDYNPSLDHQFKEGDIILYICNTEQRKKIESFISKRSGFDLAA
jgi:voltage-gated potassium channel